MSPWTYALSLIAVVYTVIATSVMYYQSDNYTETSSPRQPLSYRQQIIAYFDARVQDEVENDNSSLKFAFETIRRKLFSMNDTLFQLSQNVVTSHSYNYLISSSQMCEEGEKPFLVIMCLTTHDNIAERASIRQTWGSVVKTKRWPLEQDVRVGIKLVFLLGRHQDTSNFTKQSIANTESKQFGDIVQADFIDSYYNLTIKVLIGLRWVNLFCPNARFVLKIDDDTFVHVLNLVNQLNSTAVPREGIFIGHSIPNPVVVRLGKWRLSEKDYPYDMYPEYVSGNSYVTSVNAISRVLHAAERLPYISIEDAFISGMSRLIDLSIIRSFYKLRSTLDINLPIYNNP